MSHARLKASIPAPLRQRLGRLRLRLGEARTHPQLVLSQMPLTGELIAAAAPPARPPILVTALPRSGSTWVGRILGESESALYLQEPMTQSYLNHIGRQQTPIFEWEMCRDGRAYDRFAALAFGAIPRFSTAVVARPDQWRISGRTSKRVVVKDVNPLVVRRLWERFRPSIVVLVRHPVPVARSFRSLGWTRDQFRTRFLPETLAALEPDQGFREEQDFWEQCGAFQALAHNHVIASLRGIRHLAVRYEDVCRNPVDEFKRIFAFCGLPFSDAVRRSIETSSRSKADYLPGTFDTDRNSVDMTDRWRHEVDEQDIERVRRGYFGHRSAFYQDAADW